MPPNHQNTKFHQSNLNPIPEEPDVSGKLIVDTAYTFHKNLGHGFLEKVYEIWCFSALVAKNNSLILKMDFNILRQ